MRCLSPLTIEVTYNGTEKKNIHSLKRKNQANCADGYLVSCGQCIACRINRARMWSIRNAHEAMFHDDHCFITLTYNPEHLPTNLSVSNDEHQKFIKRLRKAIKKPIKFYMAAEYGQPSDLETKHNLSNVGRPHYHYLIYGWVPPDLKVRNAGKAGNTYYTSQIVQNAWQHRGFDVIGTLTTDSAAYVAGYCTKKITGDTSDEHYTRIHPETGESLLVLPEFQRCSQGLGRQWVEKYYKDMRKGFITNDGKTYPIPRYYLQCLDRMIETETNTKQKAILMDAHDQTMLNRTDPEDFSFLPDFENLQYRYNVAKVYQDRQKQRDFLNQQF